MSTKLQSEQSISDLESVSSARSSNDSFKTDFCSCPRCNTSYDYMRRSGARASKVPLVLPCKHVMCEECIIKTSKIVTCAICGVINTIERNETSITTFPPHYALIGFLMWHRSSYSPSPDLRLISDGTVIRNNQFVIEEHLYNESVKSGESELTTNLQLNMEQCKNHEEFYNNIRCENCNVDICCYCVIENHKDHKILYLYKMNEEEMLNLKELKSKAIQVLKQLHTTYQKLQSTKSSPLATLSMEIGHCFNNLHGQLHWIESSLQKQLLTNEYNKFTKSSSICEEIYSSIKHIQELLTAYELIEKKQINVVTMKEHLEKVAQIPCILNDNVMGAVQQLRLDCSIADGFFDDKFTFTSINQMCNLSPISNFDDTLHSELNISINEDCITKENNARKSKVKRRSVTKVFQEVIVTHINGLHSFFVQPEENQKELKQLNILLNNSLNEESTFEIGKIYNTKFICNEKTEWRRGKLLQIISSRQEISQKYNMFLIDYGNTCTVSKNHIAKLSFPLQKKQPLAIECQLNNFDSICNDRDSVSPIQIVEIIKDKNIAIKQLRSLHNNVKLVDLMIVNSNGAYDSLLDLLSSLNFNSESGSEEEGVCQQLNKMSFSNLFSLKYFDNKKLFLSGQSENVLVTNVIDPFHIYVQMVNNADALSKLSMELKKHYANTSNLSCVPVEDSDVVFKHCLNKKTSWYRGRIKTVKDDNTANIFLVDYGYSVCVPWEDIRLLTEHFIKMESQAIHVKMADVDIIGSAETWSDEAVTFLKNKLVDQQFKMSIYNENPLEVVLFQTMTTQEICINALLVQKNLAISVTGYISQCTHWPIDEQHDDELDSNSFTDQLLFKAQSALLNDKKPDFKTVPMREIIVVKCVNPDLIYIKFKKLCGHMNDYYTKLQIEYSSKRQKQSEWNVGEYCVIIDRNTNKYKRGLIKAVLTDGQFTVELYDEVKEVNVLLGDIFVFTEYFRDTLPYVVKCSLDGIKPAGDSSNWSNLAIELLQRIFTKHKAIHEQKSDIKDCRLLTNMWYCLRNDTEALMPPTINYISINKLLVESGLALWTTVTSPQEIDTSSTICDSNETSVIHNESNPIEIESISECKWLSKVPIRDGYFEAVITCCESDGHVIVRTKKMDEVYRKIEEAMKHRFDNLFEAAKGDWSVNSICTVKVGNLYYRGVVTQIVDENQLKVELIDFGSEDTVSIENAFQEIMFPDTPPTVFKLKLYDVQPLNGVWGDQEYDAMVSSLYDKATIEIKTNLEDCIPEAELYDSNGVSINQYITEVCPTLVRLGANVEEALPLFEYNLVPLPDCEDNEHIQMDIVNVLKYNQMVLTYRSEQFDSTLLEELKQELQVGAVLQPPLINVELRMPCVCHDNRNNVWCRAMIYNTDSIESEYVIVFYVDYGTLDTIKIECLRTAKPSWIQIPIINYIANLNIFLKHTQMNDFVLKQLTDLCGESMFIRVISFDPLCVDLYKENGELWYQNLISSGLVTVET